MSESSISSPAVAVPPEPDKIPTKDKVIYGAAGIADLWGAQTLNYLQVPIFTIALGISPSIAGLIMVIFRLWGRFQRSPVWLALG